MDLPIDINLKAPVKTPGRTAEGLVAGADKTSSARFKAAYDSVLNNTIAGSGGKSLPLSSGLFAERSPSELISSDAIIAKPLNAVSLHSADYTIEISGGAASLNDAIDLAKELGLDETFIAEMKTSEQLAVGVHDDDQTRSRPQKKAVERLAEHLLNQLLPLAMQLDEQYGAFENNTTGLPKLTNQPQQPDDSAESTALSNNDKALSRESNGGAVAGEVQESRIGNNPSYKPEEASFSLGKPDLGIPDQIVPPRRSGEESSDIQRLDHISQVESGQARLSVNSKIVREAIDSFARENPDIGDFLGLETKSKIAPAIVDILRRVDSTKAKDQPHLSRLVTNVYKDLLSEISASKSLRYADIDGKQSDSLIQGDSLSTPLKAGLLATDQNGVIKNDGMQITDFLKGVTHEPQFGKHLFVDSEDAIPNTLSVIEGRQITSSHKYDQNTQGRGVESFVSLKDKISNESSSEVISGENFRDSRLIRTQNSGDALVAGKAQTYSPQLGIGGLSELDTSSVSEDLSLSDQKPDKLNISSSNLTHGDSPSRSQPNVSVSVQQSEIDVSNVQSRQYQQAAVSNAQVNAGGLTQSGDRSSQPQPSVSVSVQQSEIDASNVESRQYQQAALNNAQVNAGGLTQSGDRSSQPQPSVSVSVQQSEFDANSVQSRQDQQAAVYNSQVNTGALTKNIEVSASIEKSGSNQPQSTSTMTYASRPSSESTVSIEVQPRHKDMLSVSTSSKEALGDRVGAALQDGEKSKSSSTSKPATMMDFMTSRRQLSAGVSADLAKSLQGDKSTEDSFAKDSVGLEGRSQISSSSLVSSGLTPANISEQRSAAEGIISQRVVPHANQQSGFTREFLTENLSRMLGQRILANVQAGNYRLNFNVTPRELGVLEVTLELRDGRLEAQINSQNAVTRDLLNESIPRLRDALQLSGFSNPNVEVGAEQNRGDKRHSGNDERGASDSSRASVKSEDNELVVVEDLFLDPSSVDLWV